MTLLTLVDITMRVSLEGNTIRFDSPVQPAGLHKARESVIRIAVVSDFDILTSGVQWVRGTNSVGCAAYASASYCACTASIAGKDGTCPGQLSRDNIHLPRHTWISIVKSTNVWWKCCEVFARKLERCKVLVCHIDSLARMQLEL